jgi:hypothetical protein
MGSTSIFNKDDMKAGLLSILRSSQKQGALIKSFFKMKGTRYILDALA